MCQCGQRCAVWYVEDRTVVMAHGQLCSVSVTMPETGFPVEYLSFFLARKMQYQILDHEGATRCINHWNKGANILEKMMQGLA